MVQRQTLEEHLEIFILYSFNACILTSPFDESFKAKLAMPHTPKIT